MPRHPYADLVSKHATAEAARWFLAAYDRLDPVSFPLAYAGAGRRLGMQPLSPSAAEQSELERLALPNAEGWPLSGVGRAALLLECCGRVEPIDHPSIVSSCFTTGDNAERAALLRTLPLLPDPERFVDTAVDACRSSVQSVFEAIACENPFPSRFFPDLNFNQLVLKAFFTEVPVRRIVGLEQRLTPELARMAEGYASERRAAGRSVPSDLSVVTHRFGATP